MKTSKKDFELFIENCEVWIDYFGLKDWHVKFKHGILADNNNIAECETCSLGSIAVITLALVSPTDFTKDDLKLATFHEIMELLLARYRANAMYRFATEDELRESKHAIIRTLENTFYKDLKDKIEVD